MNQNMKDEEEMKKGREDEVGRDQTGRNRRVG